MTLEIARALDGHAALGARLFWMAGRWHGPDVIAAIERDEAGDGAAAAPDAMLRRAVLAAKRAAARVPGVAAGRDGLLARRVRQQTVALRARFGGRVVYHETNMIPFAFGGTTVAQVNDLSWLHHPDMHPRERIVWIERNLDRLRSQPARYVAISEFTARGLAQELGIPRARIDVVPCAPSAAFVPLARGEASDAALRRHGLADRGYVLSVSTLEPRKNFDRLAAAHASLPAPLRRRFPLAIAGGSGWGRVLENPAIGRAERAGELRLLGHVSDADLAVLTARAACFAYVSLYEGFGLPVVEAMAAGTPVIASATTATGETAGDAADLVDPIETDAIAAAIRRVLEDPAHADALRARGAARAATFSWRRTADELVASWERALGS